MRKHRDYAGMQELLFCVFECVKPSSRSLVQKHLNDLSMCEERRGREVEVEMSDRGEGENVN